MRNVRSIKPYRRPTGLRMSARPQASRAAAHGWYRFENRANADEVDIYIYDEIGQSWFGGIGAADFVAELREIEAPTINVHINSPGGDVFDGVAIYNALRQHDATINVIVDSLAASIASVIAMAGDTIAMAPHATMMIHDASGFAIGTSADMKKLGDVLDRISDNIAGVYADRAGGATDAWRARMLDETWLVDDEAVELGLADRVADPDGEKSDKRSVQARFDLAAYGYRKVPDALKLERPAAGIRVAAKADAGHRLTADLWDEDEICIVPRCQKADLIDVDICRDHLAALYELMEPGESTEAQEMAQDRAGRRLTNVKAAQAGSDGCCDNSDCPNCEADDDCDDCTEGDGCKCTDCPASATAKKSRSQPNVDRINRETLRAMVRETIGAGAPGEGS